MLEGQSTIGLVLSYIPGTLFYIGVVLGSLLISYVIYLAYHFLHFRSHLRDANGREIQGPAAHFVGGNIKEVFAHNMVCPALDYVFKSH